MERIRTNDKASTSKSSHQQKKRTTAFVDATVTSPQKKVCRKVLPPNETMISLFEEGKVPTPLRATNGMVQGTLAIRPTDSTPCLHPLDHNRTSYSNIPQRTESELIASLPRGSLPLQYASMSAPGPFGARDRWLSFDKLASSPRSNMLPSSTPPELVRGFHASDLLRSNDNGSYSTSPSNLVSQEMHLALVASQSMSNSNGNFGVSTTPCQVQLQQVARKILEDILRVKQESQSPYPVNWRLLLFRNSGSASIEPQTPSGSVPKPTITLRMPAVLGQTRDNLQMNAHQAYLRQQIEFFEAALEDIYANTRGRNKQIHVRQVGIRCRYCAHIPPRQRQKGTAYFPATMRGLYQAAQNMSTNHIQCGLCTEMPDSVKTKFIELWPTRNRASRAGSRYWEEAAKRLGLVDTENGIAFQPELAL